MERNSVYIYRDFAEVRTYYSEYNFSVRYNYFDFKVADLIAIKNKYKKEELRIIDRPDMHQDYNHIDDLIRYYGNQNRKISNMSKNKTKNKISRINNKNQFSVCLEAMSEDYSLRKKINERNNNEKN